MCFDLRTWSYSWGTVGFTYLRHTWVIFRAFWDCVAGICVVVEHSVSERQPQCANALPCVLLSWAHPANGAHTV